MLAVLDGHICGLAWTLAAPGGHISTDTTVLTFTDNDHLRQLVGELGVHLKLVEKATGLTLTQRGSQVRIGPGEPREVHRANSLLQQLYRMLEQGRSIDHDDFRHGLGILQGDPGADLAAFFADTVLIGVDGKGISPRTGGQRAYLAALRSHDIVFGVGPAGTGKTFLAMAIAVAALKKGDAKRIILTRPAVEAGEKLGFLPGDLNEKVDPYLRPLYDALAEMIPAERVARMLEKGVIEVAPLAFMRGRTLKEAIVVLDEAQNTTREQMRMFLTRLGPKSKMVITGDVTQIDLPRKSQSGMVQALRVLSDVEGIGVTHLTSRDVVRHPLVARIIDAYAEQDEE